VAVAGGGRHLPGAADGNGAPAGRQHTNEAGFDMQHGESGADKASPTPASTPCDTAALRQAVGERVFETRGQGFLEITREVQDWAAQHGLREGLLTLFIRHTSASLVIQENVDPDVQADMLDFFRQLVVEDTGLYRHSYEGPDDQPAHIRGALTASDLKIPMRDGRLMLGRYQGIFLFEHRTSPKTRHIALHLLGS
jgi:secondary thiamine-phosphate synthase enzyme